MKRLLTLTLTVIATALALTACGEKVDRIEPVASLANSLSVQTDGLPSVDDVGLAAAQRGGWLARAGVDVHLSARTPSADPLAAIEAGHSDVAIVSEPELMLARSHGATVIGLAALVDRPLAGLVAVGDAKLHSLAALRGRTVGLTGNAAADALFDVMLRHAGVSPASVKTVDVGPQITSALLSGRVKVAFGADAAEASLALREHHHRVVQIAPSAGGVPTYDEMVFATTEVFFAQHVDLLRRFVQAVGRGTDTLRVDPSAAVSALQALQPSLSPRLARAEVTASLPGLSSSGELPAGWQDQAQWNAFGRWMTDRGLIDGPRAWAAASTNQLLAGQGP